MAESVKVIVRTRPMNEREKNLHCKNVLLMDSEHCNCSIINPSDSSAPPKTFSFDSVYNIMATTEQIYSDIVYPLVEGVLEGYNSTVFAYGQTGCGKSYTMQGCLSPPSARGIIPRSFEHIFEAISVVENKKFLVVASYLEIYNEDIRDLLGSDCRKKLDLKENPQTGISVPGLSLHTVQSADDCEKLIEIGVKNRVTGASLMNSESSRSHSIFTIALEMMPNQCLNSGGIRKGKLNLVDLAGSERQAKTGCTGDRLKEATKINLSLMALGNVISALVDGKSKHIPYRDSKLTRLLQDSLGGNTKTLMIACLSPADDNYDETLSTLRYANRAKNIRNKPKINEDPKDAMLREYQEEIEKLKMMLKTNSLPQAPQQQVEVIQANKETEKLKNEYENEMLKIKEEYEREQKSKQKLEKDMDELRKHYEEQMEALKKKNEDNFVNVSQQQVIERLKQLQASMVGGERAGDKELKEKRLKKKKAAEKRLEALAAALSKVKDEDGVMLKVYDDIQEELKAKTETLRKSKQRIKGLEREISDLQSEFENERTDYLETIRRGQRQIQLYQQISDKMTAALKKECNYCNLEKIKQEAIWSDELECWKIPELSVSRTKLPPAGTQPENESLSWNENYKGFFPRVNHADAYLKNSGQTNNLWMTLVDKLQKQNGNYEKGNDDLGYGYWNNLSERLSSSSSSDGSAVRLEKNEIEDLAGTYFKPRRADELLNKAREDATRAFSTWREYVNRNKTKQFKSGDPLNHLTRIEEGPKSAVHGSLNSLNLYSNLRSHLGSDPGQRSHLNSSWNGVWETAKAWENEFEIKKPVRLEALPILESTKNTSNRFDKRGSNTLGLT
ncbi:hypothetical protein RUM43_012982 [Polyplax serrata]|uniref:Kinesin-like protein n=1 Tax=Polyplax serrata TaxID=468196 RepID=A0AAN8RSI2_POLSC